MLGSPDEDTIKLGIVALTHFDKDDSETFNLYEKRKSRIENYIDLTDDTLLNFYSHLHTKIWYKNYVLDKRQQQRAYSSTAATSFALYNIHNK